MDPDRPKGLTSARHRNDASVDPAVTAASLARILGAKHRRRVSPRTDCTQANVPGLAISQSEARLWATSPQPGDNLWGRALRQTSPARQLRCCNRTVLQTANRRPLIPLTNSRRISYGSIQGVYLRRFLVPFGSLWSYPQPQTRAAGLNVDKPRE